MQSVTRDAVRQFATALITLNGKTTTLEVKDHMRHRGYWATQATIREAMLDITSKDGNIVYTDNGFHREYAFRDDTNATDSVDSLKSIVQALPNDHVYQYKAYTGNVCTVCGRSEGAIVAFGWKNCVPSNNTVTARKAAGIPTTVTKIHPDLVPATYRVSDAWGNDSYRFFNVTRSEAKQKWSVLTAQPYFNARTKKENA